MTWKEIPKDVILSIRDKWNVLLTTKYKFCTGVDSMKQLFNSTQLWNKCKLCDYIEDNVRDKCPKCPAYKDGWCKEFAFMSRLHPIYHGSIGLWRKDVKKFVDKMNKLLQKKHK